MTYQKLHIEISQSLAYVSALLPTPCSAVPVWWLCPRKTTTPLISLITCLSFMHRRAAQHGERSSFSIIKRGKWHHSSSSAPTATTITLALLVLLNHNLDDGDDKHRKQLHYMRNSTQSPCISLSYHYHYGFILWFVLVSLNPPFFILHMRHLNHATGLSSLAKSL